MLIVPLSIFIITKDSMLATWVAVGILLVLPATIFCFSWTYAIRRKYENAKLQTVELMIMRDGLKIKYEADDEVISWNSIKRIWCARHISFGSVLGVMLKDGPVKRFVPGSDGSDTLLKIRKTLSYNLKQYKKDNNITEIDFDSPVKMWK